MKEQALEKNVDVKALIQEELDLKKQERLRINEALDDLE
jgi:hypothetical protein